MLKVIAENNGVKKTIPAFSRIPASNTPTTVRRPGYRVRVHEKNRFSLMTSCRMIEEEHEQV